VETGAAAMPAEQAPRVFISYRREDSGGHAGRLYDALVARFGAERVFMDVDAIPLGAVFADVIEDEVARCDVLIAMIGHDWVSIKGPDRQRRLDNPADFVRLEISAALKRDVSVIPTLVQGAQMPRSDKLPDDISALAGRNGIQLRDDSWASGVAQLVKAIESLAGPQRVAGGQRPSADASPSSPEPGVHVHASSAPGTTVLLFAADGESHTVSVMAYLYGGPIVTVDTETVAPGPGSVSSSGSDLWSRVRDRLAPDPLSQTKYWEYTFPLSGRSGPVNAKLTVVRGPVPPAPAPVASMTLEINGRIVYEAEVPPPPLPTVGRGTFGRS
jgi:hypothetical protein